MPKKQWTEEERQAFGAKMKAARAKKQEASPEPVPEPVQANNDNADIAELLRRIQELEAAQRTSTAPPLQNPQVDARGSLIGTYEKYHTEKGYYPNPVSRLSAEERLQRFAFTHNFELDFNVSTSSYQTKDGINTREPKFTLKLIRIILDEDTGEPTDQRFVASTLIFHEDPDTALTLAMENAVDVGQWGEKEFLDEMRYLRMRDWLVECFYPPKPPAASAHREVIIGNKLVEVFTVNSEQPSAIPFDNLKKKL